MFPFQVAGSNLASGGEKSLTPSPERKKLLCKCPSDKGGLPTLVGVPISFWEPTRVVEVTRHPGKLIALGGMKIPVLKRASKGAVYSSGSSRRHAHYHVHVYEYPIFNLIEMANDLVCTEFEGKDFEIEIAFMSETDPTWYDEKLLNYLNPEMILFANPIAQISCSADCLSSTMRIPNDRFFWCAGCQGSLYPLFGFVAEFIGGLQASLLLNQRVITKLHQWNLLQTYKDGDPFKDMSYCKKEFMIRPKRSQYKTQLVYPVASTKGPCNPLGKTEIFWGAGKSFPVKGEEFCYILWTHRRCCLDPVKAGLKLVTGQ